MGEKESIFFRRSQHKMPGKPEELMGDWIVGLMLQAGQASNSFIHQSKNPPG
jgi:hypothetical protein